MLAVLGNHDYESGKWEDVSRILRDVGVTMLDGDSCIHYDIGFVGVKGFAGGFGDRALQPWGEEALKHFVRESIDEGLKLESAWPRCMSHTDRSAPLLTHCGHDGGEIPEIIPFLDRVVWRSH